MKRLMNLRPTKPFRIGLGILPFIIILVIYLAASNVRLAENSRDKLLPSFDSFVSAIQRMAFEPSKRTGEILLWADTFASLERLALGVGISALIGLTLGIINGLIPLASAPLSPLVRTLSLIPPMAILPILFIMFGLGEASKVALIVIGIAPFIVRDLQQRVAEIPSELLIKAQTLGASTWLVIVRVVLPQLIPRLIDAVRLSLGAAWLFLIAAEAIAATEGLGYRIFLVRRYLAMDVILPYVAWVTFLAYVMDASLRRLSKKIFPWYHGNGVQAEG
ncbi:MAG: ABC transporter permease subunit [Gammaproteobacteria bacterium]|nr:ABC transporter permease subunit [Gammaproteobacteria bacterium]